jgi:hypothetical protein
MMFAQLRIGPADKFLIGSEPTFAIAQVDFLRAKLLGPRLELFAIACNFPRVRLTIGREFGLGVLDGGQATLDRVQQFGGFPRIRQHRQQLAESRKAIGRHVGQFAAHRWPPAAFG